MPNAQAPHPPITVIVTGRRPQLAEEARQSFFFVFFIHLGSFPEPNSDPSVQANAQTLTPW